MDFTYSQADHLCWDSKDLLKFVEQAGLLEPFYLYNADVLRARSTQILQDLQSLPAKSVSVHYAMKANPAKKLLSLLRDLGFGLDVVSGGELHRGLEMGFRPEQIVFSGVGKSRREIEDSLFHQIGQINVESLPELERLISLSQQLQKPAQVALRINPEVQVQTHPYIATGLRENKFGLDLRQVPEIVSLLKSAARVSLRGISFHIGSNLLDFAAKAEAIGQALACYRDLRSQGFSELEKLDLGGGVGFDYQQSREADELVWRSYLRVIQKALNETQLDLQFEPGRFVVGRAGALLAQVEYVKSSSIKEFVILNSGFNHLLRPALYQAFHRIFPLRKRGQRKTYDVVGPLCESADFFAKGRDLSEVKEGDWLLIADSGAYGAAMMNQYNLTTPAKEVWLE
jgi:diaminopimelate decarboxylase